MARSIRTFFGTIAVGLLSFAGCAPTIPHELADARTAYQRAAGSRASDLSPAELHKAKEALVKAVACELVAETRQPLSWRPNCAK